MKITVLTSNSRRHKYLLYYLYKLGFKINAIIEKKEKFKANLYKHKELQKYFSIVKKTENKIFPNISLKYLKKKIDIKIFNHGDLKKIQLCNIKNFLNGDKFIVFGTSIIENSLLSFLIKKNCINLHMGISPYYRGTNCNFWACINGDFHLIGATIHKLSSKVDDGPILYHCLPKFNKDPMILSMQAVKSAITSIGLYFKSKKKFKPIKLKKIYGKEYLTKYKDFEAKYLNFYPKKIKNYSINKKQYVRLVIL